MMSKLIVLTVCLFSMAAAQVIPPHDGGDKPRVQVWALEGLGGLGGFAAGSAVGAGAYLLASIDDDGHSLDWGMVVTALCAPVATGLGVKLVGDRLGEKGSLAHSIACGCGQAPLFFLVWAFWEISTTPGWTEPGPRIAITGVAALTIPLGAVIAYNSGARGTSCVLEDRLEPPGLGFTAVRRRDGVVEHGVKLQLATIRL